MKRLLLAPFLFVLIAGCNTSKATSPIKEIEIPSINDFENCKATGNEKDSFVEFKCREKNIDFFLSKIEPNVIHISFSLYEERSKVDDKKVYIIDQFALDCKNKESLRRFVSAGFSIGGKATETKEVLKNTDWDRVKITNEDAFAIKVFKKACPPKKGYEKINTTQFDFKNILKSGNRRNISAFNGWDYEYLLTLDCKKMLFGIDKEPQKPIRPKSLSAEVYKRVCK